MVVKPQRAGFNYHIHPGGFFDLPTHRDRNSINILITPKFKLTIDIDMVCLYKERWFHIWYQREQVDVLSSKNRAMCKLNHC